MPVTTSALARQEPENDNADIRWAFRLMAQWLGDPGDEALLEKMKAQITARE